MRKILFIVPIICMMCLLSSCNKEFYANKSSDRLTFSEDTISFDTIFTEKGSTTLCVKIKNKQDGIIKIDKIYLENGKNSEFYINVNGQQGPSVEDVEIASGDSIFVFIQTKLNDQNVDTILYHEERLLLDYNTIQDQIVITAWGQDVVNYRGTSLNTTTFSAEKPYVIYDSLIVNEGQTLTIEAGAKIFLHYGADIIVRGTLKINGNQEHIVQFSSDRLEQTYQLLPGQWGSIIFESTSRNNEISYAKIINGVNGLVLQGDANNTIDCAISNTQISNMSGNGIYAINSNIKSYNSIFANCEYYIINILGGQFVSIHNTICNDGTPSGRKFYPSVNITDFQSDSTTILLQNAQFFNSIIVGTMSNEISMNAQNGDNTLPCLIQHCLIRDTYTSADTAYYKNVTYYDKEKNLFSSSDDFTLDTLSQASNIGELTYGNMYPIDMLSHSRIADSKPDVGAIEYFYEEKKKE